MKKPTPATTLNQLIMNCNPQVTISRNQPFYVDIDDARNPTGEMPIRIKMMKDLLRCATNNLNILGEQNPLDHLQYVKALFIGNRGSGKSTELTLLAEEISEYYETIFIGNINVLQDRFKNEKEFIYFVAEQMISYVEANDYLNFETRDITQDLFCFLENEMFSNLSTILKSVKETAISATPFTLSAKLLASLSANRTYNEKVKETIETNKVAYFDAFISYVNDILDIINVALLKRNKTLLLIIDGLDKITDYTKTEITFESLTKLHVSMIVTYPLYLMHSHKTPDRFNASYELRPIKTHERDQSDCSAGIRSMWKIVNKRVDVKVLFENPDDITQAIRNSGGNISDLLAYLVFAATNADACDRSKIKSRDLELAYFDKQETLNRMLTDQNDALALKQLYQDATKKSIPSLVHKLVDSEYIIEYSQEGWRDLHPMVACVIKSKIEAGVLEE